MIPDLHDNKFNKDQNDNRQARMHHIATVTYDNPTVFTNAYVVNRLFQIGYLCSLQNTMKR